MVAVTMRSRYVVPFVHVDGFLMHSQFNTRGWSECNNLYEKKLNYR